MVIDWWSFVILIVERALKLFLSVVDVLSKFYVDIYGLIRTNISLLTAVVNVIT